MAQTDCSTCKKHPKVLARADIQVQRLAICEACEYKKFAICRKCGCVVAFKVKLQRSKCPIGKWGNEIRKEVIEHDQGQQREAGPIRPESEPTGKES